MVEGRIEHHVDAAGVGGGNKVGKGQQGGGAVGGGGTARIVGGGHPLIDFEEIFHGVRRAGIIGRPVEHFAALDAIGMDGLEPERVD
ncbi:hypothetical protein EBZ02_09700, partial [bacterium]|nr:hypothetical protein [bacterium]